MSVSDVPLPLTRQLPAVLRDALADEGVRLVVGKVISIPDNAHVRIEIAGSQIVVPRLASYQAPVAGDAVYCLTTGSVLIAIGIATPTPRGGAAVDPGSATGQVPVWNASSGRFEAQNQAPSADTVDGIDSTYLLVRAVASGNERIWWTKTPGYTGAASSVQTINHPLGRVPSLVVFQPNYDADTNIDGNVTATQVFIRWRQATTNATGWLLLIG